MNKKLKFIHYLTKLYKNIIAGIQFLSLYTYIHMCVCACIKNVHYFGVNDKDTSG